MQLFAILSTLLVAASAHQWTIPELSEALSSPYTNPYDVPFLEAALNELMLEAFSGASMPVATVSSPTVELSYWTLSALSEALQNPSTSADLIPYLEDALNVMMSNIFAGNQQESIIVATPIGVITPIVETSPVDSVVVSPVVPVPAPIAPAPVSETPESVPVTPLTPPSPLVQIIVNVKSQQEAAAPSPVVQPTVPVTPPVYPGDIIAVNPIGVNPVSPPVYPGDIIAVNPIGVNPIGVNPVSPPVYPGDIIAVNPIGVNPIGVNPVSPPVYPGGIIAVNPIGVNPIAVNPIDIILN